MKIKYTTKNNRLQVEVESNNHKEAFKQLAEFQEIFEESNCGSCNSDDLRFIVRTVEGNDFYELKCNACGSKLAYGQHKMGDSLFPKRKLPDGSFDYKNKGWHKWEGKNI
jgi:translation initiation factor 2 beta subunit (eIF-2beta)/eIF-5